MILNLNTLGREKTDNKGNKASIFRDWNEKLVNAWGQHQKGTREIFKAISAHADAGVEEAFLDKHDKDWFEGHGVNLDEFNEDLFVVLIDKTEGEALTRVRAVDPGNGVEAYGRVYKWYLSTTSMAIKERFRKLLSPDVPKDETKIPDAIEKWIESRRILEAVDDEYILGN